ncbi:hypothetical protein D1007_54926 [Hordeum vulgare]|uniref:Predicted protein n=1 Tax=Hordeum vulgare subsp. vulgare TaxID=112509 RepID=F2DH32_HORVV|nr:uncharacterized protein LOC123443103 [Hordeum vulgare subsp. vulgare]KAE8773013.1 hypothetical protein D1007_54926 [Hordeum vulgare]BAJ94403.1 predicted protein [Hordeum vulgare subsp. vulgare]
MAAAAFSIREYAASMRGGTAAEGRRLFGIEDLPPLRAPRCRWWADEVASTLAAAAPAGSPRRAPAKAKPPKKRSLSDLFAASPPLALPPASDTGCKEQTEVDGDEALRAIARRAKEEKKRKRKRQEEDETAVAAAAPESSGGREPEGNFAGRKEALENPDLFAGLDTHSSWKPEVSQQYREKISERRKQAKINNINKKADTRKHIDNNKANKAGKPRDLENFIPRNGILKCTKHTSVKMVKEKRGSSEGKEVIELCCKSVKRVKFSEADAILELPERESLCKMFSDAMASSSSSSSSSSSFTSTEGDKCITTESGSSHMPMEAFTKAKEANKNSDHEDSADKCISAETGTSHIPMEAFTKTIEANKNYDHEDSTEPGNREMSPPLIDLNMALPESTELDHRYDSYSVVLNLEHTHEETLSSVVELLDGRENRMNFSVDSQRLESEESTADLEIITNSSSASTFLHGEAIKVSDVNAAGPPLSLTELAETHRGCSNVSVKDTMTMSTTPCALPDHTFQDSFRQQQGWFSTSDKFSSWPSHESNVSHSKELNFHAELHVPHENGPSTGQTVRLMGKDLPVCTTRFFETAQKHTGTFTSDYLNLNVFLPQQGQPFLSLQGQNFPSDTVNSTSTIHASTYHASTSQARTTHDYSHPFPATNVLSGDQLPYEDRFVDFSNSQTNWSFQLGCPPPPKRGSAAFEQNSPSRRYYSDPITITEPPTAPPLPTTRQHGTPSSGFHANLPQPHVVHPVSSSVCHLNSVGFTFNHPDRVVQAPSNSIRDATFSARTTDNRVGSAVLGNSSASPSGRYVQMRSGPVKLTPGVRHVLVPNDGTGDDDSAPVYSCVPLGSRSTNGAGSRNKGA